MRGSAASIERLRELRRRPAPGVPLGDAVQRQIDLLTRQERDLRGMGAVWARVGAAGAQDEARARRVLPLPRSTRERARPLRFARGELVVVVPDQSTKFTLDRWLRGGGLRALSVAEGSRIARVKVLVRGGGGA